jgi:hypothetical protein
MKTLRQFVKPLLVTLALVWVALPVTAQEAHRARKAAAHVAPRSASASRATLSNLRVGVWSGFVSRLPGFASSRPPLMPRGTAATALTGSSSDTTCGAGCSQVSVTIDPNG